MGRIVRAEEALEELIRNGVTEITVKVPIPDRRTTRKLAATSVNSTCGLDIVPLTKSASGEPLKWLLAAPPAAPVAPVPPGAIADLPGYADLKPDPLTAQTPAQFIELMKLYRIWAGEPSYRELVRRARNAFGASTLCEALKSTQLPPEKLVRAFIWACSGCEVDLQAWVTAWRVLRMKHKRIKGEALAPVTQLPTSQATG